MGVTLDTGALIALESLARGKTGNRAARTLAYLLTPSRTGTRPATVFTTPAVVVGEWWRGQQGPAANLLEAILVEDVTVDIATRAGDVLASLPRRARVNDARLLLIDAIVVLTAAARGDVVYTSDVDDLDRVRSAGNFNVKILPI